MSKTSRARRAAMRADARAEKPADNIRADGWANVLTGLGTSKDKRTATGICTPAVFNELDLNDIYRGSDVAATIVDVPADDMTREWIDFRVEDDADNEIKCAVMDYLDGADEGPDDEQSIHARVGFHKALKWARLHGGSALIMGVNDGRTPDKPLNWATIKSVDFLNVLDRWQIRPWTVYSNPFKPKYGKPELYAVSLRGFGALPADGTLPPALTLVHESRILRFDGVDLPDKEMYRNGNFGWGDSVLVRVWEVVRDYASVWMAFGYLLGDYAQTTIKIKGLAHALSRPDGQALVSQRMEAIELSRSIARAVMLDENEEFKREVTSLSGVPEAMQKFVERLAQAARMPIELLMGQPPGGINGNGDTGKQYWHAQINAMQERMMRPALMKLLRVVLAASDGPTQGEIPENWTVGFKSLDIPTDSERADILNKAATAAASLVTAQILDPEEVANSMFGGDTLSLDIKLDEQIRASMSDKLEQAREPGPTPEEQMQHEVTKAQALAAARGSGDAVPE